MGKSLVTSTPLGLKDMVKTDKNPNPTMEDAFIELILREGNTNADKDAMTAPEASASGMEDSK